MPRSFATIAVATFIGVCAAWTATPLLTRWLVGEDWSKLGQVGDLFGSINALFSGLAFAGVIIAILLQREELKLQRQELKDTREELARTAAAQELAANTASRAFREMERPYLYVLDVKNIAGEFNTEDPYDFIKYSVANYGKTPATVEHIRVSASVGEEPRTPQAITGWHELLVSPILCSNERRDHIDHVLPRTISTQQYADEHTPPDDGRMEPVLGDNQQFFFCVQIDYRGPFSGPHVTTARWQWDRESARLIKFGRDEFK